MGETTGPETDRGDAAGAPRYPARRPRKRLRLDRLPPGLLRQFEAEVLDDPRVTAGQARTWLADRGFAFSLAPVVHHRNKRARRKERERHDAAVAAHVARLAAAQGFTRADLDAGAALRAEHALFQHLRELHADVSAKRRAVPVEEVGLLIQALRTRMAARGMVPPGAGRPRRKRAGVGDAAGSG